MIPHQLLTTQEMAAAERLAMAAGVPGIELMEQAGAGVAEVAANLVGEGARIAILCGPGNNGGDGFVAGRLLAARGFVVSLGLLGRLDAVRGDAATAARRWQGAVAPAGELDLEAADLVVDALFGSGLVRDLQGEGLALVAALNRWRARSSRPVVAVDVPSGLDANTGQARGGAVEASATVTFFKARPGHLLLPGRGFCGRLHVHEIGISDNVLAAALPQTFANVAPLWQGRFPRPAIQGHKYSRGHTLVVSGGPWSTGAARLAARAALRAGSGLVTLASPRAALTINASHLTAIMLTPCDGPDELRKILTDQRINAVILGPGLGLGEATVAMVKTLLESESEDRSVTLDADALTSFTGRGRELAQAIQASKKPVILTPHDGEFARLFNSKGDFLESSQELLESYPRASRLERSRKAAAVMGATIVLKGPDTIVAHPDGRASIAGNAPPFLATAGSGDVLAGIISGLTAQAMPVFEAASSAVWLHAEAGAWLGPGLIAEDLPDALPQVLRAFRDVLFPAR